MAQVILSHWISNSSHPYPLFFSPQLVSLALWLAPVKPDLLTCCGWECQISFQALVCLPTRGVSSMITCPWIRGEYVGGKSREWQEHFLFYICSSFSIIHLLSAFVHSVDNIIQGLAFWPVLCKQSWTSVFWNRDDLLSLLYLIISGQRSAGNLDYVNASPKVVSFFSPIADWNMNIYYYLQVSLCLCPLFVWGDDSVWAALSYIGNGLWKLSSLDFKPIKAYLEQRPEKFLFHQPGKKYASLTKSQNVTTIILSPYLPNLNADLFFIALVMSCVSTLFFSFSIVSVYTSSVKRVTSGSRHHGFLPKPY